MSVKAAFYIIYSKSLDKYYSGITSDDMHTRIKKHNTSHYGQKYTSAAQDWKLQLEIKCPTYSLARKIELYVKRMKNRKFIERLINHKVERDKLVQIVSRT